VQLKKIIQAAGYVWWGWWKKESEPDRTKEIAELHHRAQQAPLIAGLFDRSTNRYFFSRVDALVQKRGAPEINNTPKYYAANKNIETWLRLRSIEKVTPELFSSRFGDVPAGEHTFFPVSRDTARPRQNLPDYTRLASDYVVHLSDLHFGGDHGFPRKKEVGKDSVIARIKQDINEVCQGSPGLIVVSGDLTTKGDANALQVEGLNFLNALHVELKVPKEAILVIPGNHDFRLMDYEPTDFSHERPFNIMLREFYGNYDPNERFRRFLFPSGHHAEFLLINSVRLRKKEEGNYGYVEWSLYESRLRDRRKDDGVTRVAVLHHHLISIPREELLDKDYPYAGVSTTLDSGAVIEGLQAHGFRLALHGHQHVPGVAHISRAVINGGDASIPRPDLAILSAGSAGAKSERLADVMRDNSYNLLKFIPGEVQIEARRFNPGLAGSRYFTTRVVD
jgi:predicted phosphodiesterase